MFSYVISYQEDFHVFPIRYFPSNIYLLQFLSQYVRKVYLQKLNNFAQILAIFWIVIHRQHSRIVTDTFYVPLNVPSSLI